MDAERAEELFSAFGPVRVRRMFGGHGLYADGVMFALVSDGVIYLKSGAGTDPAFDHEGCDPFGYDMRGGRRVMTSYRRAPERLLEDPDEMAEWARGALEAARAAKAAQPRKKSARSRKP